MRILNTACLCGPATNPELTGRWQIDEFTTKYAVGTDIVDHELVIHAFLESSGGCDCNAAPVSAHYTERGIEEREIAAVKFYLRCGADALLRAPIARLNHPLYQTRLEDIYTFIEKAAAAIPYPVFCVLRAKHGTDDFFQRVVPGDILLDSAFILSSKHSSVIRSLKGEPSLKNPLIYYCFEGITRGADLAAISCDQGEVLIQKHTPFKVVMLRKLGQDALFVRLRELSDPPWAIAGTRNLATRYPFDSRPCF